MRQIRVIGIGSGNPEHVTVEAIRALNGLDVVFLIDKGSEKAALADLRREICERYVEGAMPRFVTIADPPRDRAPADYAVAVDDWHEARSLLFERAILGELGENGTGAFLVWGDPSLYDSTLRILARVSERGQAAFTVSVVPGISSVQVLAARHAVVLNAIGGTVAITTGRRLAQNLPDAAQSTVVMLDGDPDFARLDPDLTIVWGAYLGTPHELLLSGRLGDVAERITALRAEARARHGWIMDTYLLSREPT